MVILYVSLLNVVAAVHTHCWSGGVRLVKLLSLACGARGPGFDSRPRHLNFQRFLISCLQVAIWLKYR